MDHQKIDARGLSCPEPVLLVKQAIAEIDSGKIEVLVDTMTSRENVTRMAQSLSCTVEVAECDDDSFSITIKKV